MAFELSRLNELRRLGVRLRRRIDVPLEHWRIRRADRLNDHPQESALSDGDRAPQSALPWSADAARPGWQPAVTALAQSADAAAWRGPAMAVKQHRFQILAFHPRLAAVTDSPRAARLRSWATELPGPAVDAYVPIDWHADFYSGHRWDPEEFYLDVRVAPVAGADIKVPRELSRFQHVAALAAGPLEEGGIEFLLQVLDWIAANPPRRGVNWACTMDVALRAVSWVWGLRLFEPVLLRFPEALATVLRSLRQHGQHVQDNLEYYEECTSNHYLANVAGLVYLGAAFPQLPEADRWLLFGLQELVAEMRRQVYPDGGDYEASTHYHRLVAELFVSCACLAERIPAARRARLACVDPGKHKIGQPLRSAAASGLNLETTGPILPGEFYARLVRMGEFTAALMKPNGLVVQFGDNDSARAHVLLPEANRDTRDHAHLIATIAELSGREDLRRALTHARLAGIAARQAEASWRAEAALVAGGLSGILPRIPPSIDLSQADLFFPDSGIAVSRRGSGWLAVICGPNGQGGRGGHGHNDKLSFELNVHGDDFIVDGGCPAYTSNPGLRNRFRSTWAHSTVAVLGVEQDEWVPGARGLFRLPERCRRSLRLEPTGAIAGEHDGYGAPHRRRFVLEDGSLLIEDELDLRAERWVSFNLDPAVAVCSLSSSGDSARCELVHESGRRVRVSVDGVSAAFVGAGSFGEGYGRQVANQVLRARLSTAQVRTRMEWDER